MDTLKRGLNGTTYRDIYINFSEAPSTEIEKYKHSCKEFMQTVFHLNTDDCFLSDDSTISDFAGCEMPDELIPHNISLKEFYQLGMEYTIGKIREQYNIEVSAVDLLIDVFEKIKNE